ncbi:MAG: translation initiation factor IF-3 [Clostridia bacterium]|nr:translation initiation factor IF-3 [Clostridia bacterium]MBQ8793031.1 translation initiation factor IF-3 [Clostridia bacterium]
MNEEISASQVRLIGENGEQLGIVSKAEALSKAEEAGLDLVLMSGGSVPPVCKILDYGKFKYDAIKKDKEIKKAQKIIETKEIQLSMTIEEYDIAYRVANATKFLQEGNKVKVTLKMKGREQAYVKKGFEIVNDFCARLSEVGTTEKQPEHMGRNIFIIISPKKTK